MTWIGLFPSDSTPDTGFITGQNWQWATTDGPGIEGSYATYTSLKQSGYQARYLSWDSSAGVYRSIVRDAGHFGQGLRVADRHIGSYPVGAPPPLDHPNRDAAATRNRYRGVTRILGTRG